MTEHALIRALKALGDGRRLQMVREIACAGELSCGQVKAYFRLSQPTISHHLKILARAGLITVRDAGQHRLISVNSDLIHEIAAVLPVSVHTGSRKKKPHESDTRRSAD